MIRKQHFVFDLDDTLMDGQAFCGEVMARTITSFEPRVNYQQVIEHHELERGRTIQAFYKSAIDKFKLLTPLNQLLETDREIMANEYHKIIPFEGTKDLLKKLKSKGKKLYICTNRKSESLIPILKHNNMLGYFEEVISCADANADKPDPTCLVSLVEKINTDKDEFLYIGDSEKDSLFAKNAGMDCIIIDQYLNGGKLFKNLHDSFLEQS